jgi:hypothetical protein
MIVTMERGVWRQRQIKESWDLEERRQFEMTAAEIVEAILTDSVQSVNFSQEPSGIWLVWISRSGMVDGNLAETKWECRLDDLGMLIALIERGVWIEVSMFKNFDPKMRKDG